LTLCRITPSEISVLLVCFIIPVEDLVDLVL